MNETLNECFLKDWDTHVCLKNGLEDDVYGNVLEILSLAYLFIYKNFSYSIDICLKI